MCGRYNLTASSDAIVKHFQLLGPARFLPSYNIAPAQKILNIVELEITQKKSRQFVLGSGAFVVQRQQKLLTSDQCTK